MKKKYIQMYAIYSKIRKHFRFISSDLLVTTSYTDMIFVPPADKDVLHVFAF